MAAKKKSRGRVRRAAGTVARGGKATLAGGVAGAASFYGHRLASEHLGMIRSNWWAAPVALLAVGHFAKRRPKFATIGAALCGAAGYAGAMGFTMSREIAKHQSDTQGIQGRPLNLRRYEAPAVAPAPAPMPELPEPVADVSALMSIGRKRAYAA